MASKLVSEHVVRQDEGLHKRHALSPKRSWETEQGERQSDRERECGGGGGVERRLGIVYYNNNNVYHTKGTLNLANVYSLDL